MDDNDQTDTKLSGKAHAIPISSRIGNKVENNDSIDLIHTLGGSMATTTTKMAANKKRRSDTFDDDRIDFEKKPSAAASASESASGTVLEPEFETDIGSDDVIDEPSEHALLSDETLLSKKPRVNWKKPFDMPKRPLSAYNLFFRSQRQHLLGSEASIFPITDQAKRKHRKTHGKIGFEEMAKSVGQKWKDLDKETKSQFEKEAAIEKDKYTIAMEEYNRRKREAAKSGRERDETLSSPFVSQHADQYDDQQLQQQQQNLLDYFSSDPISANIVERSRLFLDDASSSRRESQIGSSLATSRLLDMSLGSQLRRQQQDLSSNLQQLYGTDALSQMMLMQADDSSRATERRSWHRSGSIDNEVLLDTSTTRIPTLGSFLPDYNSSRNRLSSSDSMSLVDSLIASGTHLDQHQQEQQQQQERRRSWNLNLRNTDQMNTGPSRYGIPYVSLQASDEELSEYYFCLLQEVMTVKDELDRRSTVISQQQNTAASDAFGTATTSLSNRMSTISSGGLPSSLRASIRDVRRGLSLPLYDDVNMPPQQHTQQSYEREADLLSRARLLQEHVLQQRSQQQQQLQQQQNRFQILPQLQRRHSSMDTEPTSGTSTSTHAFARRISDSQRQFGSSTLQDQQKKHQT